MKCKKAKRKKQKKQKKAVGLTNDKADRPTTDGYKRDIY